MLTNSNHFSFNFVDLRWGRPPVPILPRAFCRKFGSEPAPAWVLVDLRLDANTTIADLCGNWWVRVGQVTPRVGHYANVLLATRCNDMGKVKCFDRTWPRGLSLEDIPFGVRVLNRLRQGGYLENPAALMDVTFAELLRIEGLGTKSLLELTCMTDAAIDIHEQTSAEIATVTGGLETGNTTSLGEGDAGSVALLGAILDEPWADQISDQDPRFAAMLPSGPGTLEDCVERILADPAVASKEVAQLLVELPSIRRRVADIQAMTLEDSLMNLLLAATGVKGPRFDAIVGRLGWAGADPKTLQECGTSLGVTRERFRQIESKVLKRLPSHSVFLPQLDLALDLIERGSPMMVDEAAALVAAHGISRMPFSTASILETARLLGRLTALKVRWVRGQQIVGSEPGNASLSKTIRVARALAGRGGVASVFQVVDRRATESLSSVPSVDPLPTEDEVRRILHSESTCELLDDDWFWFTDLPAGRNRLENLAKKMLCVASPQSHVSIREGVRRAFTYRSKTDVKYRSLVVPPVAVMKRFFQRHPDFRIEGEQVAVVGPLNYRDLLGEGEKVITEVLRAISSGVLDRKSLTDECVARGLNSNTVSVYTSYSPVLEHLGLDLWKLRGVQVDPAAVEAVREQNQMRPKENRLIDFGWSPDGKLWIAWRLPGSTNTLVLGVPGAVRRYLTNVSFQALFKDGARNCGQISINEGGVSYGYGPFLRLSGGDEGDTLLAEFDLSSRCVILSVGDVTVLEQG